MRLCRLSMHCIVSGILQAECASGVRALGRAFDQELLAASCRAYPVSIEQGYEVGCDHVEVVIPMVERNRLSPPVAFCMVLSTDAFCLH